MPALKAQLRQATLSDAPALAEIGYSAFGNEAIDGHWFPHKDQYPEDYRRAIASEIVTRLVTPGNVIMLAEIDEGDSYSAHVEREGSEITALLNKTPKAKKVVGYIVVEKHGSKAEDFANWNPDTLMQKIRRYLLQIKDFISSTLWPNRAVDAETYRNYYEQATKIYVEHLDTTESPWIDCRGLAVLPSHQRRGYGEQLLNWIAHKAWLEDVPIFGDSSPTALPIYLRGGSEQIGKVKLSAKVVDAGPGREPVRLEEVEATLIRWKT